MGEFDGRVALVTGAGSGIGAESARVLASSGAHVVVSDVRPEAAEAVAERLRAAGGLAEAAALDIADGAAVDAVVGGIVERHGRLDLAVNNAAITGEFAAIVDTDPETWARVIDVNLVGTYRCLRAELRAMLAQGSGSIVTIGSITSVNGQAFTSAYNASKHALAGLTKTAALEAAPSGVRVNMVAPGYVRTPLLAHLSEEDWEPITALHPLGRVADPAEIAQVVLFLLSERASFVTGAIQLADGGFSAR